MEKKLYIAVIDFSNIKTGNSFSDSKLVHATTEEEARDKVRQYYNTNYPYRSIDDIEISEPID